MMKKLVLCLCGLGIGVLLMAQGQVSTRKYRLADFTDKVTKVVLSEGAMLDGALRQEVVHLWTSSAFEFCTPKEFEELKTSEDYYFLLPAASRFKGEEAPGITFLTLVKGGPDAAQGISSMHEVISLPLVASAGGNGREFIYMGAIVKAIQDYTMAAMESEKTAYLPFEWFNDNFNRRGKMMQLYFAREDLSTAVMPKEQARYMDADCHILGAEEVDDIFMEGKYNSLVSYTVAPASPEKGSVSYQMLFLAQDHTLFYISKHKISFGKGAGFLPLDLKKLAGKR